MTISITKPTVGGSENTWGTTVNTALDDVVDVLNGNTASTPDLTAGSWKVGGTAVTSSAAEINKLDGFTGDAADLNYAKDLRATGVTTTEFDKLDGLTASTSELNKLDGLTASTSELNTLDGLTASTSELNKLDGFTGDAADLNYAKDLRATGVTTTEFDKLDGLTASTTELNHTDGVTSNIQTQLNGKLGGSNASATITTLNSTTVNATTIDLGDWTISQSGSSLKFSYNGTARFALSSSGALTVENDVTAFGSA